MADIIRKGWVLIVPLFAVCIVAITFGHMFLDPGHFMPFPWGDSAKNILSYLYHTQYGRGIWFTGLNYPYGEHIVYMDAQPLLCVPLSYCHISVPAALAVMWYAMQLSYVLAIIYVYRILVHFRVKAWHALLFSALIVVMSPQLYRTMGHYGLSYTCIVPMLFYWTIQYHSTQRLRYPLYVLVMGLMATFIHPYLAAIVLLWVCAYALGYCVFIRLPWRQRARHILPMLLSLVCLFGIVGFFMKATDPLTDRASMPYGLTVYCTQGGNIFTSHYSPIWRYLEEKTTAIQNTSDEEGFTYLGLCVLAAIILSILARLLNRIKKKGQGITVPDGGFNPIWLFIAFAALLLAMGVPFVWNMEWLVNYLSFLRQFRTLGRFSWIFYYVATIYGVVIIYGSYARYMAAGRRAVAYVLVGGVLALWGFEASGYVAAERTAIKANAGQYDIVMGKTGDTWPSFLAAHHHSPADFQAMLLLPIYNLGMDKLWVGDETSGMLMGEGLAASMQTRLPEMDAIAHSSWAIAEKQVRIAAGPYANRQVLGDLPNGMPLLILNNEQHPLDPDQQYLLSVSETIGTFRGWHAYACYPDRLRASDKKYTDSARAIASYMKGADTCLNCSGTWFVNHFDTGKTGDKFFGNGAVPQITQFETTIAQIPISMRPADGQYEFSCWFLLGNENYRSPYFKLDLLDAAGNAIQTLDVLTKESTDNKGLWFRAFKFFAIPPNCAAVRCRLFNEPDNTYKVMDELLLRPAGSLIISRSANGAIMANNHLF